MAVVEEAETEAADELDAERVPLKEVRCTGAWDSASQAAMVVAGGVVVVVDTEAAVGELGVEGAADPASYPIQ